jgi:hypothetical protein
MALSGFAQQAGLGSAEQIHLSVDTARAEARKRAEMKENFENLTLVYLKSPIGDP